MTRCRARPQTRAVVAVNKVLDVAGLPAVKAVRASGMRAAFSAPTVANTAAEVPEARLATVGIARDLAAYMVRHDRDAAGRSSRGAAVHRGPGAPMPRRLVGGRGEAPNH